MLSATILLGFLLAVHVSVRPTVTLNVRGDDAVPAADWWRARAVTTRILNRAGLDAVWEHGADCAPPALCVYLSQTRPSTLHADAAGYALLWPGGGYASVFLPGVARTAAALGAEPGTMLGATMAHEIGHLLLGSAHSAGVMSARFDWQQLRAAERGELLFRDEDARRMRLALAALIK